LIRLAPECYPCFLRQADLAAVASGASEEARMALQAGVAASLPAIPLDDVPARAASRIWERLRADLGDDDPFRDLKERELARFGETSERARQLVSGAADPLGAALLLSAFGNVMDSGIVDEEGKGKALADLASGKVTLDVPPRFRERFREARRVTVLLDNAGEAAWDVPFLDLLLSEGKEPLLVAKGGAVIDDLTAEEAVRIGLDRYGTVLSNGNRSIGTDLSLCPPAVREAIGSADLVLSKGQGNFETLWGRVRRCWYLLRCKCPVISRATGRAEGELMLIEGAFEA
jgi:uncharacterized protein with ATP-grasp and redox domains